MLTFCDSDIPILTMTNLMMSHQGLWRMSWRHAGTHCPAQSSVGHHVGANPSLPHSCVCIHPINLSVCFLGGNVGGIPPNIHPEDTVPPPNTLLYIECRQPHHDNLSQRNHLQITSQDTDNSFDRTASLSRGICRYNKYAELSNRPRVLMMESSTPAAAAVVTVPMRKLWPAYCDRFLMPATSNASLTCHKGFSG